MKPKVSIIAKIARVSNTSNSLAFIICLRMWIYSYKNKIWKKHLSTSFIATSIYLITWLITTFFVQKIIIITLWMSPLIVSKIIDKFCDNFVLNYLINYYFSFLKNYNYYMINVAINCLKKLLLNFVINFVLNYMINYQLFSPGQGFNLELNGNQRLSSFF